MRYRLKSIEVNTDMGRTTAVVHIAGGQRIEYPVPIDSALEFEFGGDGVLMEVETLNFLTRDEPGK